MKLANRVCFQPNSSPCDKDGKMKIKAEAGLNMPIVFANETNGFHFGPEPPLAEMSSREGWESTAVTLHEHLTNPRKAQCKRQMLKKAKFCYCCHYSLQIDPILKHMEKQ